MTFDSLGLSASLLRTVKEKGYETPTPIQASAIPIVLSRRDLMGCAQTGTGKTAAFALPMLDRLFAKKNDAFNRPKRHHHPKYRPVRGVVLAPTRELAAQIYDSFDTYGRSSGLRFAAIFGGVSQKPQVRALDRGVDILIATPGRLLDLMNQGFIDLSNVSILVLDEADQMLDMGFLPDLKRIVAAVPQREQTLMFSATMPDEIRKLAEQWLDNPEHVQVAPAATPIKAVAQSVYFVAAKNKPELLAHYIQKNASTRTLVFARTKHGADKIVKHLIKQGIHAAAIHSNKSQSARTKTLDEFKSERPPVLVATDIAARGLDVRGVSHVINYELPEVPETYVHRIGRTGRAGAAGIATSFCAHDERSRLSRIERLMRHRMSVHEDHPEYAEPNAAALEQTAPRGRRSGNTQPRVNGSRGSKPKKLRVRGDVATEKDLAPQTEDTMVAKPRPNRRPTATGGGNGRPAKKKWRGKVGR